MANEKILKFPKNFLWGDFYGLCRRSVGKQVGNLKNFYALSGIPQVIAIA
ncbi:hypothetical protein KJ812_05015 [Patescibacteria group bacterium]|nr:hypothetical protein [Patescibacteria group bacterium]MBU4125630.1 hypothetical protein [Patescibacteria group bacterium]